MTRAQAWLFIAERMRFTDMNKTIIGGIVAAAVGLGIAGAGTAQANSDHPVYGREGDRDVTAYIPEMYPDGVYLSAPQALLVATRVCVQRSEGFTRDQVIEGSEQKDGASSWLAIDAVMGAEFHFCPQFDSEHVPGRSAPMPEPMPEPPPPPPPPPPPGLNGGEQLT